MAFSKHPRATLALVVALTLLSLGGALSLRFGADLEAQLKNHPSYRDYLESRAWFGVGDSLAVDYAIDALDARALIDLHHVVARLSTNRHVAKVVSLLDFLPRALATDRDIREYLAQGHTLDRFRTSLAWYRLARGLVIARDGKSLGLLLTLRVEGTGSTSSERALASIERDLHAALGPRAVHILGYSAIERRVIQLLRDSYRSFVPVALAGGIAILWLFLRRAGLVLVAALSVFAPLCWLLALQWLAGVHLNSFSTMLLPLMMAVGLSNTMYILSQFVNPQTSDPDAIEHSALARVVAPQLLCTATNSMGFLSLLLTGLPVIERFGAWGTLGCVLSIAAAFVIVPCGLRLTGPPISGVVGTLDAGLARVGDWVAGHRRTCLVAWLVILAWSAAGTGRIVLSSSATSFLLESDPLSQSARAYDDAFAPSTWVELCVRFWPYPASHPRSIERLAQLQRALEADPLVHSTLSLADVLLDCGSRISGRRLDRFESLREIATYQRLLASEGLGGIGARFVSTDGAAARIIVRLRSDDAFQVMAFARRFLASRATAGGGVSRLFFTGPTYLSSVTHEEGVRKEVGSLWSSILTAIAMLGTVFLSLGVALISAIPNVAPILLCYGLMGWIGGPLNVATGVMGPVIFGIIMDDTVYILYRFRMELARGGTPQDAYRRALAFVGRPVVMNALTLASGLGISALAPFPLARSFGIYSAITVGVGVLCDLMLLPTLLTIFPGVLRNRR